MTPVKSAAKAAIVYPVQRAAGAAKGRATQAHERGTMNCGERVRIHTEANRVLGHTFHSHKGK